MRLGKKYSYFSLCITAILAFLLLMTYLSMYINPAYFWWFALIAIFFIPLFFLNLLSLIYWFYKRSYLSILLIVLLLPSFCLLPKYYRLPSKEHAVGELKILSYNVGNFIQAQKKFSLRACRDSVLTFVLKQDPDIACLQECDFTAFGSISQLLTKLGKMKDKTYYVARSEGQRGILILSRFPIKDYKSIKFSHSANRALYADFQIDNEIIRVYNCHFQSYGIAFSKILHSKNPLENFPESKFRGAISKRPLQVNQIVADIKACPYPSFIVGDFNDGPNSYTYHSLLAGKQDSFEQAGSSFAATYSVLWPLIRIDYILAPPIVNCISHNLYKIVFSDHYPIVASFNFKEDYGKYKRSN